jgi:hypothetical protein
MNKFYNLTIHKYKSSHELIKHLNPTKHIQICEKINKSHVQKINGGIRRTTIIADQKHQIWKILMANQRKKNQNMGEEY